MDYLDVNLKEIVCSELYLFFQGPSGTSFPSYIGECRF